MKILYVDLNYIDFFEDYSYEPQAYGGGRVMAGPFLEKRDNFYIASDIRSFLNVREGKKKQCYPLTWPEREKLRRGVPLLEILPESKDFDVVVHHFANICLNLQGLNAKQVCWPVGWRETVHPKTPNVALFNQRYQETFLPGSPKVFEVTIGPNIPPFQEYQKEDMIFQCTRQEELFQSIYVAKLALKYGIKLVLAGPIAKGYPLLDYIDEKTTFYLGQISETLKTECAKKAKAITQFQQFPTPITLAAKHALAYGCFVMAIPVGEWPEFVKDGVNGFIVNNEDEFKKSWDRRNEVRQVDCHNSVLRYSEDNMIASFEKCFAELV